MASLRGMKKNRCHRVRYSITKYGWTLTPVLEQICGWGRIHLVRLEKGARQ